MNRLTLGEARNSRAIYKLIENGVCPTNAAVVDRINEAQERLLAKGKWYNMKERYCFCAYDGCVTLPRNLESILAIHIDKQPVRIQSQWYEFIDSGAGIDDCNCCGINSPIDRGNVSLFRDICGDKYIRVYCDVNEDTTSRILIKGYDTDGNRVMTNYMGSWIDGEYISLAPPYPKVSTKVYSSIETVIKDVTKGYVRLYQYDATTATQSAIAIYAPDEEYPVYRRYKIPSLSYNCETGATDNPSQVTLLAKKRFIPAVNDTDDLLITNIGALKNMIIAIVKEENGEEQSAQNYENRAERILNEELKNYRGGEQIRRIAYSDVSPVFNVK